MLINSIKRKKTYLYRKVYSYNTILISYNLFRSTDQSPTDFSCFGTL